MTEWISHRGLLSGRCENTRQAFNDAIAAGFTHLEGDLHTSADGHLVFSHDPDLTRLAQAPFKGWQISAKTRAQLEQVRLACGEPLMFFDEFFACFGHYRWILDIKPATARATVAALLRLWQSPPIGDFLSQNCRFLFWHREPQRQLLSEHPRAVCMADQSQCRRAALACLLGLPRLGAIERGKTYAVPPTFGGRRILKPTLVARYQQLGARVLGYLPAGAEQTEWALAAGVDEILTNLTPPQQ